MSKWLLITLAIASLTAGSEAQTHGGFGGFHNGGGIRIGPGFGSGHGRGSVRNGVWLGEPFGYADYPMQTPVYAPPASSVVIVQPNAAPQPAEPKPEPLMIEWQGDKYVRISGGQRETATLDYSQRARDAHTAADELRPPHTHPDLPPVVLVFRDGHREQVADYVIANGSLYARGDYWRDGFWTKTIQLATLDVPATLRTNSQARVNFVLPSDPNEVITRP